MHHTGPYIVRTSLYIPSLFIAGGILFIVLPWCAEGFGSVWFRFGFGVLGALASTIGLIACLSREALVVDKRGVSITWWPRERKLIPWNEIEGCEKFPFTTPEGEDEVVILGVKSPENCGLDEFLNAIRSDLQRNFGELPFKNPVCCEYPGEEEDWNADEFIAVVRKGLIDESYRASLGEHPM